VVANTQARRAFCFAPSAPNDVFAQIWQADALLAAAPSEPPERAQALQHRAYLELLPPMIALLERRRLAGTLLYGKCAPHEVEWWRQVAAAHMACPASVATSLAHFVGYQAYACVARTMLRWLPTSRGRAGEVVMPTAAHIQQIFSCAETAVDLMSAPRAEEHCCFNFESALLDEVRGAVKDAKDDARISRVHRDGLAAALGRLEASGAIEERDLMRGVQLAQRDMVEAGAKAHADVEARGLQSCAHCSAREVHVRLNCAAAPAMPSCSAAKTASSQTGLRTRRPARRHARLQ
jgi:hypothetical protein